VAFHRYETQSKQTQQQADYNSSETVACKRMTTIANFRVISRVVLQTRKEYKKGRHCSDLCTSAIFELLCSTYIDAFSSIALEESAVSC
jgi:hypothetical protein